MSIMYDRDDVNYKPTIKGRVVTAVKDATGINEEICRRLLNFMIRRNNG